MKKRAFDIRYRPEIESGEMKVITGKGKPVTIIKWDMVGRCPILGCTMVSKCNWDGDESWEEERPIAFDLKGNPDGYVPSDNMNLYLLMETPATTAFEEELSTMIDYSRNHAKANTDVVDIFKDRIFEAARLEVIKGLPHWEKCKTIPGKPGTILHESGYIDFNDYHICVDELFRTLPKKED